MRVSIGVTNYSWPSGPQGLGAELTQLVRGADQAGVDTVWVVDHLLQADPTAAPGDTEMLEAYTTLGRPVGSPPPTQRPGPPVLIGGTGERKILRLVAQYADACNLFDIPDGGRTVKHKLAVLARHCADLGRPSEQIEKTLSSRLEAGG